MQNRGERSFIIVDPSSQNTTYSLIDNGTEEIISKYVASSRGKYFYEVQSDRAKSLSEKNKVYFKTFEEAKNAGFKPYFGS